MPEKLPILTTAHLTLRPFTAHDVARVTDLAGDRRISDTTLLIPHPYTLDMAEEWICTHQGSCKSGNGITLAVTHSETGELIGAVGITIDRNNNRGDLGYWIGVPYWGSGYCTEAARAMVDYGFREMELHKISAHHCIGNPASGRVMQKIGMTYEGRQTDHVQKSDSYYTIELYGILNPTAV